MKRAVVMLCAGAALAGCHSRRIVVTSEPPGALVYVNDVEIGRTPAETAFTFYGDFDVRLVREGYEPLATNKVTRAPWYEKPPIDLLVEALPVRTETVVHWHFPLTPALETTMDQETLEDELVDRAGQLRRRTESADN